MPIYTDENGYKRHSSLVHRQKAYKQIYTKNRKKYPLPFSEYVVHHKDGDKQNNDINNLEILTPQEHENLHFPQLPFLNQIYPSFSHHTQRNKLSITFFNFFIFHGIMLSLFYILLNFIFFKLDGKFYFSELSTIPLSLIMYLFLVSWWIELIRKAINHY